GNKLKEEIISNEDWNGLAELCNLLYLFAQASVYLGCNQYPTLGTVYSTIQRLFKHLNQIEKEITHLTEDPSITGWLAIILDPRFKSLSGVSSTKQDEIINELRIRVDQTNENMPNIVNLYSKSDMSLFFEDESELFSSSFDIELQVYFSISPIP
ncbi:11583_t:CDS:2, partial [Cetraspora pellucida]